MELIPQFYRTVKIGEEKEEEEILREQKAERVENKHESNDQQEQGRGQPSVEMGENDERPYGDHRRNRASQGRNLGHHEGKDNGRGGRAGKDYGEQRPRNPSQSQVNITETTMKSLMANAIIQVAEDSFSRVVCNVHCNSNNVDGTDNVHPDWAVPFLSLREQALRLRSY